MQELLLVMTIKIDAQRYGTIQVYQGDNPEVLARNFCLQYDLNQRLVPILIENINQNLDVVETQKQKSAFDTMQYSTETCNSQLIETPFNPPLQQLSSNTYYSNQSVHERLYEDARNKKLKQKIAISDSRIKKNKTTESEINYGLFLYQKGIRKQEEKLQRAESAKKDLQNSLMNECTHHPKINQVSKLLVQRNGQSVGEHLNKLAQEQKLKRDNASAQRLAREQSTCSFKPQINRISRFIVEEKNERNNQPWYEQLYQDHDTKIQKIQKLEKAYFSNHTFHPKIDMISEKIVQGSSFEERQRLRSTSRQNLSICEDENHLFKPKTGRPPERRPRDLFQSLYNQASIWEQNKKLQRTQQEQAQLSASQIKASDRSNSIMHSQIQYSLKNIFLQMDHDHDGYINADNIDISGIECNIIKILHPLLIEMEEGNYVLNQKEFVESAERLIATLTISERHELLKKPSKKTQVPQYSFNPTLNTNSKRIVASRRH